MAVDVSLLEKITVLRQKFFGEDPSAIATINEWEARIQRLSQDDDFFQMQATQEIYKALKERAKEHMRYRLQKGRTPEEMTISDNKQGEIEWILSLFNPDFEQELATLDSLMDAEITN